jgi:hypothetical protein
MISRRTDLLADRATGELSDDVQLPEMTGILLQEVQQHSFP